MKYYDNFIYYLSEKSPTLLKLIRNFTLMEWLGVMVASGFIVFKLA
jgi:hypothetical protein